MQFRPAIRLVILALLLIMLASSALASPPVPQPPDTLKKTSFLDCPVEYDAVDTSYTDLRTQKVYLMGQAKVTYCDISLSADYIEYDFKNGLVQAYGRLDSTGKIVGRPLFKDATSEFVADRIEYNFKTRRGRIFGVKTQEGEGYLLAGKAKKQENDDVHIEHGKYTTCNLDSPHYYFHLGKAIVKPNDKIVGKNINLVVADIPTPLWVPFAFFPNQKKKKAGILIPTYGESVTLGFYLLDGGYFIPINERLQTAFRGDIYSRGSWALKNRTDYKVRYKYGGNFDISYRVQKVGEPEYPDFTRTNDFFVRWNHQQDPKARPGSRLTADVNFGTTTNFENDFSTSLNDNLTNTFASNVRWNKSFTGTPFSLNVNLRHSQNNSTGNVSLTLPDIAFNMNRIYPGKQLRKWFGKEGRTATSKWYEKIGVTYNTNFRNEISVDDSLVSLNNINGLINNHMRNGIRHNITASTSFAPKALPVTFTPSFNLTERWYTQTINRFWDNELQELVTDTIGGFDRAMEYNAAVGATTRYYITYLYKNGARMRHVITPSVNLRYRPDFGTTETIFNGNGGLDTWSPYQIGYYGAPSTGESGLVTMSLINNFEAKVPTPNDTASKDRKITIIENFGLNTSYDFFATKNGWANLSLNGRTRLFKKLSIVYNGQYDPYDYDSTATRIDDSYWSSAGGLGRFSSHRINLSTSFRSKKGSSQVSQLPDPTTVGVNPELDYVLANPEAYVDFNIPWTLNVSYALNLNNTFSSATSQDTLILTQTMNFSGDFSLTPLWKIGFSSGYDFVNKDFTQNTSFNLYRDLHCWEMSFNYVPFGPRQSYNIQVNVKASVLQDLKLARRRSWIDSNF